MVGYVRNLEVVRKQPPTCLLEFGGYLTECALNAASIALNNDWWNNQSDKMRGKVHNSERTTSNGR